jgi:hypothetical protein
VRQGVNAKLAEKLGLVNTRILAPKTGTLAHVVEVGMGRINGHVGLERGHDSLLHQALAREPLQRFENNRMVAQHHIAAPLHRFGYYGWGAVQGNQHASYLRAGQAALQAGIVVALLIGEGSGRFEQLGKVLNGGQGGRE